MLTVTTAALDRLLFKLTRRDTSQDVAMRVLRKEGGWTLRPDTPRPFDTAFIHEGRNVLILDKDVSTAMQNKTLGVRVTEAGPRLKLRNRARKEN